VSGTGPETVTGRTRNGATATEDAARQSWRAGGRLGRQARINWAHPRVLARAREGRKQQRSTDGVGPVGPVDHGQRERSTAPSGLDQRYRPHMPHSAQHREPYHAMGPLRLGVRNTDGARGARYVRGPSRRQPDGGPCIEWSPTVCVNGRTASEQRRGGRDNSGAAM
jgi:hypothetical protein